MLMSTVHATEIPRKSLSETLKLPASVDHGARILFSVTVTRILKGSFGFAPDENAYVRQCTIDNKQEVNEEVVMTNLEEFYNVSLFICTYRGLRVCSY